jgi:putative transcriptional regulator
MNSLKGHFLVASPHLVDPNFVRTVVLLIHHSEEGAFGVVLNRPAESTVRDLWEKVGAGQCDSDQHVHVGGPVPGPLMAVHADRSAAEMEIVPGVYFAAQRENLEKLVHQHEHPYRLFVNHSGWGGGQLENELKQGAWFTLPATVEFVFADYDELWKRIAFRIGDAFWASALGIRHFPAAPWMN